MKKNILFLILSLLSLKLFAQQTSIALKVTGTDMTSLNLSLEQIKQFPAHQIDSQDKNGQLHHYKGVYVQDILTKAGAAMGTELHGKSLAKYVLASCADGYQVLFSLAELDSSFVSNRPIIAYQMDDQPLSASRGPLRIINPNDNKPARNCFQLKALSVHYAKE